MNTTVIIIMIICATVISLVAILCNHCFETKLSTTDAECRLSKKVVKLHRNYIVGILGFAIIMLLTAKFGGPNNAIFEYLSFGSTITSLVLSILAIFVTVQSSSDLYKQFSRIDNATDTIDKTSTKIDGTLSTLQEVEANLISSSSIISSQLEDLVEKIDEKIKARMKETEDNISKQLAQSQNTITQSTSISSDSGNSKDENKQYFIGITSANGLIALYACALSAEKSKMFELSQLFKGNEAYSFGYLIGALSAKYVHFTNDSNNNQITAQSCIYTKEELYNEIKNRIGRQNLGSEFVDRVNLINEFFDVEALKVTVG